ncbi:CotH kinase family protein [Flavobacteriales bacterium]|nr:CotH kinase family protein [Flavobacteriales bacterium]
MNFRIIGLVLIFLSNNIFSQSTFYHIDTVREIKFNFDQPNWKYLLDSLYVLGDEQRIIGTVTIDGYQYDSVGIRYKGYSSVNITQTKNPFNIKLDYIINDQEHQGFNKIKLSNVIHDPSFLRESLSYQIARKYMPSSKANFANLYINDTLWGVYSNVEAVNKDFLSKHYQSRNNSFFKCNPSSLDLFGENSNLSLSPGNDSLDYEAFYSIKSDYGWGKLYQLIDTLNNYPSSINKILNVDRTLWMHAFNYSLVNLDSYIGYAQNYYLYEDNSGRFNPILWDLNMSFGSFRLTDASSYFSGMNISQAKTLDPLSHLYDVSVFPRPLMRNIFNDNRFRKMYMAHLKTIMEENFSNLSYLDSANKMHQIIDQSVNLDSNKFYSYLDFQNNIDSTVTNTINYPGIKDLMSNRMNYLSNYSGYNHNITIDSIKEYNNTLSIGDDLWITANIIDADQVVLFYRFKSSGAFQESLMLDNGNNNDGAIGDFKYGAKIPNIGNNTQYFIYAENDSAGQFSPERAAYEFYEYYAPIQGGDLVINEILAINDNVVQNEFGDYADWIELYNNTNSSLSANELFITDDSTNLLKWNIPDINIPANGYLILWADEKHNEGIKHTNFKLANGGEKLILSNNSGQIIDYLNFPTQSTNIGYARIPNGTGNFVYNIPSFGYDNDFANISSINQSKLSCYPNPFKNHLNILLENPNETLISICDIQGKIILQQKVKPMDHKLILNTSSFKKGMYFVYLNSSKINSIQKIIKD